MVTQSNRVQNSTPSSYTVDLGAFGTNVKIHVKTSPVEEQLIEIELAPLQQQKDLSALARSYLEKLLALLAEQHDLVRMRFDPVTGNTVLTCGSLEVETDVISKHTTRDDLPVLLEDAAARQLFYAAECALKASNLSEGIQYCYNGAITVSEDSRMFFEILPEYQPYPVNLFFEKTSTSLQFSLNETIQIILTLNPDGSISQGDTYSAKPEITTWGKKKKGGHNRQKSEGGSQGSGNSGTVRTFYLGGLNNNGVSLSPGGGGGGKKPPNPDNGLNHTPVVIIDDDDDDEERKKREREEELEWLSKLEWPPGEKDAYFRSLPKEERDRYLHRRDGNEGRDSGYNSRGSRDSLNESDDDPSHTPFPKDKKSQWGDGDTRRTDQRSRQHKDYVKDGQEQKAWDTAPNRI